MTLSATQYDAGNLAGLGAGSGQGEFQVYEESVSGGTLYITAVRQQGGNGLAGVASSFVPTGQGGTLSRNLNLCDAKSDAGVGLTTTASGGAMGISRTAGTSLVLKGEVTSSSTVTDKAAWEFNLPTTYVAGASIPVSVTGQVLGTGTLTAANTTISLAAYVESLGTETAIASVTAAQEFGPGITTLAFTVPGTGLQPGENLLFELTMAVATSTGGNTGEIMAFSYQA